MSRRLSKPASEQVNRLSEYASRSASSADLLAILEAWHASSESWDDLIFAVDAWRREQAATTRDAHWRTRQERTIGSPVVLTFTDRGSHGAIDLRPFR